MTTLGKHPDMPNVRRNPDMSRIRNKNIQTLGNWVKSPSPFLLISENNNNNNNTNTSNTPFNSSSQKDLYKTQQLILNSSPGMATFIWGPLFWQLLHDVSVVYDKYWNQWDQEQKKKMNSFWSILRHILPCKYCRESYKKFFTQDKPSYPFVKWTFELHNKVNAKLKKPLFEQDKFQRKQQVYHSFSSAVTIWDILFILALNYDPIKKKKYYKQWFYFLPELIPYLVKECYYNPSHVQCFIDKAKPNLRSKVTLLNWLSEHSFDNQIHSEKSNAFLQSEHRDVSDYIMKFAPAISQNTKEEMSQLCGPLIERLKKCKLRGEKKCKKAKKIKK